MSYQGTQIGPDGKRRPTGESDPFVSGVELPVVEDDVVDLAVAFTPPEFLELLGQEPAPEPEPEPEPEVAPEPAPDPEPEVAAEAEPEPEVAPEPGEVSAPDYSDYDLVDDDDDDDEV
jgi:flagellar protein FlaE